MIQIITGQAGTGKTKQLLSIANEKARIQKGHVVYIDSTTKHRYDLSHHVRLIEATTFPITSPHDFFGFLCGILSSNHDVELVLIDELVKITHLSINDLTHFVEKLKNLSEKYHVDFIIGATCSTKDLPENLLPYLVA
ncbi:MAG: AAA family ATPase [Cellulosilyticaceae bacterium]